jgi:hypothetical protein
MAEHRERARHFEYLASFISTHVVNFSMCHPKKPVKPADLMPWLNSNRKTQASNATPQQAVTNIRCFLLGRLQAQGSRGA